jgi:5-(carboxyamino)imidazole ribonucleotide synthase
MQTVGVIGGGQLAWMMATGAQRLGLTLAIQTPKPMDPAVAIAQHVSYGAVDDAAVTTQLAQHCQVITFENEFIDLEALAPLEQAGTVFYPSLSALRPLLDKYDQRGYLRDAGLPTPKFAALPTEPTEADLLQFGLPVVVKARRQGYDGYGTIIVRDRSHIQPTLQRIQQSNTDWLLEAFVPFERELAIMVARSASGEMTTYPVVETQQIQQVCRRVLILNDIPLAVRQQADTIAKTLVTQLEFVGIMGIELFLTSDGLLVNETAPRTHNSGHYSLDACSTSQFEQQLRAVTGQPLGDARLHCAGAVMVNLLGVDIPDAAYDERLRSLATIPDAHVYWYQKAPRPGRKLGHVTILLRENAPDQQRLQAEQLIQKIETQWYGESPTL